MKQGERKQVPCLHGAAYNDSDFHFVQDMGNCRIGQQTEGHVESAFRGYKVERNKGGQEIVVAEEQTLFKILYYLGLAHEK